MYVYHKNDNRINLSEFGLNELKELSENSRFLLINVHLVILARIITKVITIKLPDNLQKLKLLYKNVEWRMQIRRITEKWIFEFGKSLKIRKRFIRKPRKGKFSVINRI